MSEEKTYFGHKMWSKSEENTLLYRLRTKETTKEIGENMGRTEGAIKARISLIVNRMVNEEKEPIEKVVEATGLTLEEITGLASTEPKKKKSPVVKNDLTKILDEILELKVVTNVLLKEVLEMKHILNQCELS